MAIIIIFKNYLFKNKKNGNKYLQNFLSFSVTF